MLKIRLSLEPQDLYIGVFWKKGVICVEANGCGQMYLDAGSKPDERQWLANECLTMYRNGWGVHRAFYLYLVPLPCVAIRFTYIGKPKPHGALMEDDIRAKSTLDKTG